MKYFQGLIIYNSFRLIEANKYKIKRLKEAFSKLNINLIPLKSSDLNLRIDSSITMDEKYTKSDFAIYLDKDEAACQMLENFMRVFNSSQTLINCSNKINTDIILARNNLPIPKTIFAPLRYSDSVDLSSQKDFLNQVKSLGFPLVCKLAYGSMGLKVYLINNEEELFKTYQEHSYEPHLYQEFISSSYGKDIRVYLINHEVVAAMERINEKDFRSNIALGGKGKKIELSREYVNLAKKVSEILNLDFGGIDILIGKNKEPIIAEVNANAFLSEIEKVTNIDIASKIASYVYSEIYSV